MASIFDYKFNNITRIGDDEGDMSQKNIQNSSSATYMLDNYRPSCPMSSAIDFATSQLNVNYTGSHPVGINGCNVDKNSSLLMTDLLKPKDRIMLIQRSFLTVPFLGRGRCDIITESQMQQGDFANNRKSVNPSSEISHMTYRNTPMIPSLHATITNPANLIEGVAAEGWIRGGVPSRELTRDKDYTERHDANQYV
jgi:hypothetical protein